MIKIYTDGACSGNPGPGGWGALLINEETRSEIKGGESTTTNNRMELTAAIKALSVAPEGAQVSLYTDSQYVKNGVTQWMKRWKQNGWRTANNKPVKNQDLWEDLDAVSTARNIDWHWVKGHAGHPENERADALAREGMNGIISR